MSLVSEGGICYPYFKFGQTFVVDRHEWMAQLCNSAIYGEERIISGKEMNVNK